MTTAIRYAKTIQWLGGTKHQHRYKKKSCHTQNGILESFYQIKFWTNGIDETGEISQSTNPRQTVYLWVTSCGRFYLYSLLSVMHWHWRLFISLAKQNETLRSERKIGLLASWDKPICEKECFVVWGKSYQMLGDVCILYLCKSSQRLTDITMTVAW